MKPVFDLLPWLSFYLVHLDHTLVALVAGAFLHVQLKKLWLKLVAKFKHPPTPIA